MKKVGASTLSFSLSLIAGIIFTWLIAFLPTLLFSPLDRGPLDYNPRLEASAENTELGLTVKVYRQRDPSYSLILGADVMVKVYDRQGRVVYEQRILRDGAWSELDVQYRITFEMDEIRVLPFNCRAGCSGAYFVIRMKDSQLQGYWSDAT